MLLTLGNLILFFFIITLAIREGVLGANKIFVTSKNSSKRDIDLYNEKQLFCNGKLDLYHLIQIPYCILLLLATIFGFLLGTLYLFDNKTISPFGVVLLVFSFFSVGVFIYNVFGYVRGVIYYKENIKNKEINPSTSSSTSSSNDNVEHYSFSKISITSYIFYILLSIFLLLSEPSGAENDENIALSIFINKN